MAWTCYVTQRAQGDDIGTVVSVWDEGGPAEESIDCGPWKVENASRQPILDFAEAELAFRQAKKARDVVLSDLLTTFMNA